MKEKHDAVKKGYHRMDFGPDEKINHRIEGAYAKQPGGHKSEKTKVHKLAKHQQVSKMVSGKDQDMDEDC